MKEKYLNMKIPGRFCLMALALSTAGSLAMAQYGDEEPSGPPNPDLDTDGVRLVMKIVGAYEVPDGTFWGGVYDNLYLSRKLSRNPKPRNEWRLDKWGAEKFVDDDNPGWVGWNTLYVDTTKAGSFELIFRGKMEFFRDAVIGGSGESVDVMAVVFTPNEQLFLNILHVEE